MDTTTLPTRLISRIAVIATASCALAATLAPAATAAENPKIAAYNVFMLSRNLYPNWGQVTRADLIDSSGVLAGQDVVVLNELFDNTASDRLLRNLADTHPHQTPVLGRSRIGWDATQGAYSDSTPEDGGVSVVSRWPITRKVQHVYRDACGAEVMANKGFVYVRIAAPSGPLHVVGTHAQAEDSSCGTAPGVIRARQRAEVRAFLATLPTTEPVYVAGDLNVIESSGEYPAMLRELGAVAPAHTGHPYSWDCPDNSVCQGQYGPEYAPEHLDYVLPIANQAAPASYVNETRRVKSPRWSVTSWWTTYSYNDFSDHYPVFGY
ncbi:sphingomyelin phosphodiesterase [Actinokineospora soli]|uniref:Sphingomyelin phosphodiesterase n=1 Tax=Actinokineospora soli TaxID=1048753 RepID=A0ABW2TQP7_9PSEU